MQLPLAGCPALSPARPVPGQDTFRPESQLNAEWWVEHARNPTDTLHTRTALPSTLTGLRPAKLH
jgi:hypothetical protein